MSSLSLFDIAGPVMIGPSSSHTAGACKIGQFARALFHHTPTRVVFNLHGSFAEVFKGHATDKALLAGVMKFRTSDPRMPNSFQIAKDKKITYEFREKNLGEHMHPNSVEILLKNKNDKISVVGSSIGGGMIEITKINGFDVHLKGSAGKRLSLVVCHNHTPFFIKNLTEEIHKLGEINVATTVHSQFKDKIITVLGLEGRRMTLPEVIKLEKNSEAYFIRSLSKLQTQ